MPQMRHTFVLRRSTVPIEPVVPEAAEPPRWCEVVEAEEDEVGGSVVPAPAAACCGCTTFPSAPWLSPALPSGPLALPPAAPACCALWFAAAALLPAVVEEEALLMLYELWGRKPRQKNSLLLMSGSSTSQRHRSITRSWAGSAGRVNWGSWIFSIALPALRRNQDFSADERAPPCSSRSPFLLMNAFSMRNVFCADTTSFFSPSSQRAIVFRPSTLQRVSSGRSSSSHQSFIGTFVRPSAVSFTSSSLTILREMMFLICTWNFSGRLYAMWPSVTIARLLEALDDLREDVYGRLIRTARTGIAKRGKCPGSTASATTTAGSTTDTRLSVDKHAANGVLRLLWRASNRKLLAKWGQFLQDTRVRLDQCLVAAQVRERFQHVRCRVRFVERQQPDHVTQDLVVLEVRTEHVRQHGQQLEASLAGGLARQPDLLDYLRATLHALEDQLDQHTDRLFVHHHRGDALEQHLDRVVLLVMIGWPSFFSTIAIVSAHSLHDTSRFRIVSISTISFGSLRIWAENLSRNSCAFTGSGSCLAMLAHLTVSSFCSAGVSSFSRCSLIQSATLRRTFSWFFCSSMNAFVALSSMVPSSWYSFFMRSSAGSWYGTRQIIASPFIASLRILYFLSSVRSLTNSSRSSDSDTIWKSRLAVSTIAITTSYRTARMVDQEVHRALDALYPNRHGDVVESAEKLPPKGSILARQGRAGLGEHPGEHRDGLQSFLFLGRLQLALELRQHRQQDVWRDHVQLVDDVVDLRQDLVLLVEFV
uniref:Uncharacterized protein n=1 Tax=Anopheles atroparvus TaxID=41427 RepID=A0A182J7Y2_ANOAO